MKKLLKNKTGKITVIALLMIIFAVIGFFASDLLAASGSGSYPGIGDTLPLKSLTKDVSSYTKVYFMISYGPGKVVKASDGSVGDNSWSDAAIDCVDDADFKRKWMQLPSGLSKSGNAFIEAYGSSDATADSGDVQLGHGYVRITVVGGSAAFADLPQAF